MKQTTFEQATAIKNEIARLEQHHRAINSKAMGKSVVFKLQGIACIDEFYNGEQYANDYIKAIQQRMISLRLQFDALTEEQDKKLPEIIIFPEGLKYVCVWNYMGEASLSKCKIVTPAFFCEDNGYEIEDITRVAGMKAGDVIEFAHEDHMIFCIA